MSQWRDPMTPKGVFACLHGVKNKQVKCCRFVRIMSALIDEPCSGAEADYNGIAWMRWYFGG